MKPEIIYDRVEGNTFRALELNTVDGFAYVWIWGDAREDGDYEEHVGLTIGLDGIE